MGSRARFMVSAYKQFERPCHNRPNNIQAQIMTIHNKLLQIMQQTYTRIHHLAGWLVGWSVDFSLIRFVHTKKEPITRLILVLADRMNVSIRSVGHGKVNSLKPRKIAREQYNVRCD